ncbi:MAG: hypothetical protein L0H53_05075 [Candidatus Nitrosocosmicus sp.]|nr:hypothetical protein [Candidatus Nitrosocosmicus sp.]MDN5867110.1 hypothetical protein [Candidatus Nitrosocosmicus sp.]
MSQIKGEMNGELLWGITITVTGPWVILIVSLRGITLLKTSTPEDFAI